MSRPLTTQPIPTLQVSSSTPDGMAAELAVRLVEQTKLTEAARAIAVALEQELARVEPIARDLARDLTAMDDATAIDLDRWPAARALVAWR